MYVVFAVGLATTSEPVVVFNVTPDAQTKVDAPLTLIGVDLPKHKVEMGRAHV